jgi:hypothetical protein
MPLNNTLQSSFYIENLYFLPPSLCSDLESTDHKGLLCSISAQQSDGPSFMSISGACPFFAALRNMCTT